MDSMDVGGAFAPSVHVPPGSGRDLSNWLDLSTEAQARIVTFGKHGALVDATAYHPMVGHHRSYSRAEIERPVDYVRSTPEIVLSEVKVADPAPGFAPAAIGGPKHEHRPRRR